MSAKAAPGSPSPFIVVVANSKDANEWTETESEYLATVYPAISKGEAVALMNDAMASGFAVVARIFRYDPRAGAYSIDDEWGGGEVRAWQS